MHQLKQEQFLPIPIEEAWHFFSSPKNLNKNLNDITPNDMVFDIISEIPETMYEGLLLTA